MERNKGVKRRFKSQAKQIFRSCLYELTKRPPSATKEGNTRQRKRRKNRQQQSARCKKKKKRMETQMEFGMGRNVKNSILFKLHPCI